jgi:hypothetical protein
MTNKFKFKFKITGLELEVEGSKEDVAAITSNLGNQLKNLTQTQGLNGTDVTDDVEAEMLPGNLIQIENPKKRKARKSKASISSSIKNTTPSSIALDAKFEIAKFGTPKQDWKSSQKAMWILYVFQEESRITEMTGMQIVNTFNKHFKQAGLLNKGNLPRDFGKLKIASPPLLGEDTTKSPSTWFLTEAGIKGIQNLIAQQKSNGTS